MDSDAQRLHELEKKWLNNTITQEEAKEYARWYNKDQDSPVQIPVGFARNEQEHENRMLNAVRGKVGLTSPIAVIKEMPSYARMGRWAAIAAVLIGVAVLSLVIYTVTVHRQNASGLAQSHLYPGGNKAILTLASGQQIVLNNLGNGNIANQEGVTVTKVDSGLLSYSGSGVAGFNTLSTPKGGEFQLELPDGSHIWLNSASSIKYPTSFTGEVRQVELTGEAYFEIARNEKKPFIVKVRDMNVRVLGTKFNVMAYNDEPNIETTLIKGSVKVSTNKMEQLLQPGQQALFSGGQTRFRIETPDIDQVLAWKNGQFDFDKADVHAIMRQIARWYNIDVVYEGDVSNIDFAGLISRRKEANELLNAIEATGQIKFTINNNRIIVSKP